jgi:Dual-action HEIGH metallo-peptidase
MFNKTTLLAVFSSAFIFGCSAEPGDKAAEVEEIVDNLKQAGYPETDIQVIDDVVYVGNDAEVSLEASREMLEDGGSTDEQFRTTNRVSTTLARICINAPAFTGAFSTGLNNAINNYNALPLTFNFTRSPAVPAGGCQRTIQAVFLQGVTGGSAGFPSGGNPFGTIRIGTGLAGFNVNVIEHVITHELGHTLGFRHSDFFNRSISCGGAAVNEENPPSGIGAILIPGTPNNAVVGQSIMNSCFRSTENGEFTPSDVTALNFLF